MSYQIREPATIDFPGFDERGKVRRSLSSSGDHPIIVLILPGLEVILIFYINAKIRYVIKKLIKRGYEIHDGWIGNPQNVCLEIR